MPKNKKPIALAAHLTQCYIDNPNATISPGSSANDAHDLEQIYETVSNMYTAKLNSKEGGSIGLGRLNLALNGLVKHVKSSAENFKTASPDELQTLQSDAASYLKQATQLFNEFDGPELQDPNFKENFQAVKEKFLNLEATTGSAVIKASGKTKSAAKWIDTLKDGIPKEGPVDAQTVTMIFAARQLSNAVFGKRGNIDKTQLSEQQIRQQAEILMDSPEFQKYMQANPNIDPKILKGNHGGKLEQGFERFLAKEGKEELEFDLRNRYRKVVQEANKAKEQQSEWVEVNRGDIIEVTVKEHNYASYADYFKRNVDNKEEETVSPLAHAAKMAAAYNLMQEEKKDPEIKFDRKALNKMANQYMKDPGFKLMSMDPSAMEKLRKGDGDGFSLDVEDFNRACRVGAYNSFTEKFGPRGEIQPSLDRLSKAAENDPELKNIVDGYKELQGTTLKENGSSEREVAKVLSSLIDYQNKNASKLGSTARNVDDTLRLFRETVKGTYLESTVEQQVEKLNQARNFKPDHPSFLTTKKITQEGNEIAEQRRAQEQQGKQQEFIPQP